MRARLLTVAAVVALAAAGLSACSSSKVGAAAFVDGQRVTESDVAGYLTDRAEPTQTQDATGNIIATSPRAFVLSALIDVQLFGKVLATPPAQRPDAGTIAAAEQQVLGSTTLAEAEASYVQHGYHAKIVPLLVREQALQQILQQQASNGVDINSIVTGLSFPVTVNPRYGAWDKKNFELDTSATAGLPEFLQLPGGTPPTTPAAPAPAG